MDHSIFHNFFFSISLYANHCRSVAVAVVHWIWLGLVPLDCYCCWWWFRRSFVHTFNSFMEFFVTCLSVSFNWISKQSTSTLVRPMLFLLLLMMAERLFDCVPIFSHSTIKSDCAMKDFRRTNQAGETIKPGSERNMRWKKNIKFTLFERHSCSLSRRNDWRTEWHRAGQQRSIHTPNTHKTPINCTFSLWRKIWIILNSSYLPFTTSSVSFLPFLLLVFLRLRIFIHFSIQKYVFGDFLANRWLSFVYNFRSVSQRTADV